MGWDRKQNGRYYSRSIRVKGIVRRQYFGKGLAGQLAAAMDEQRREQRKQRREAEQRFEQATKDADHAFDAFSRDVDRLVAAVRCVCRFAVPRGQFRGGATMGSEIVGEATPSTTDRLRALLKRAKAGDTMVLPDLQHELDSRPELWQAIADLGRQAEAILVEQAAGDDLVLRMSLQRKLADLRIHLGYESAEPLEALLIDRVVASWLRAVHADVMQARAVEPALSLGKFLSDRCARAERAHLHAIRQLVAVRKLLGLTAPADAQ